MYRSNCSVTIQKKQYATRVAAGALSLWIPESHKTYGNRCNLSLAGFSPVIYFIVSIMIQFCLNSHWNLTGYDLPRHAHVTDCRPVICYSVLSVVYLLQFSKTDS